MNRDGHEYRKKYPIIRPTIVKELAHGIAVSNLARRVGQQMGMTQEECYELALAGLLHDVGKLELARYVYGKENETLIIEEMRYVRRHSNLGADILQRKGYSRKIVDMVRFHHENCDGSGYPMNLSREDIPMGSRILRVCDVFAALTADRPYRKAFDIQTALEMMIDEAKYYDVGVFLAFMNVVNEGNLKDILDTEELEQSLRVLVNGGQVTIAEFLAEWTKPGETDSGPGQRFPEPGESAGRPEKTERSENKKESGAGSCEAEKRLRMKQESEETV